MMRLESVRRRIETGKKAKSHVLVWGLGLQTLEMLEYILEHNNYVQYTSKWRRNWPIKARSIGSATIKRLPPTLECWQGSSLQTNFGFAFYSFRARDAKIGNLWTEKERSAPPQWKPWFFCPSLLGGANQRRCTFPKSLSPLFPLFCSFKISTKKKEGESNFERLFPPPLRFAIVVRAQWIEP